MDDDLFGEFDLIDEAIATFRLTRDWRSFTETAAESWRAIYRERRAARRVAMIRSELGRQQFRRRPRLPGIPTSGSGKVRA